MVFCKGVEECYGINYIIFNMYLYVYIVDCMLDYGLVYLFWLYSFEWYNGYLGIFLNNSRFIEL